MPESQSNFHEINGVRYHARSWGEADAPALFLLHGWMDASASFQFVVEQLQRNWRVIAPDWRGCGLSGRPVGGYWFPDYYADLDALLELYSPDEPARLVGHSMGGVIACTYSGLRPERVARLVSLEGFGLARTRPADAVPRLRNWLNELKQTQRFRSYTSIESFAARLRSENPRLDESRALAVAHAWARQDSEGRVELLHDPRHKRTNPVLFRLEELMACWRECTAPTLWVFARDSKGSGYLNDTPEQLAERKAAFRDYHEAWIEDAGHMMHHDQPAAVAKLIEDFVG